MTTTQTIQDLQRRVAALEKKVSGINRQAPGPPPADQAKPINYIAFEKAVAAFAAGDQKPLREYRTMYAIPIRRR